MTPPYIPMEGFGMQGLRLPKWLVNPETDDDFARRYPGTSGDPIPAGQPPTPGYGMPADPTSPVAAPAAMTQRPGWAARLFGGQDPLAGGLLSPDQATGLGRRALLQTGLNILQNSGPAPYRRGLGEILAGGVQSGLQAYQQGAQHALGEQGILAQRQAAQRLGALRQQYQGRNDPASLTAFMHDLIAEGTPEALAGARSISEVLKTMQPARRSLVRSEERVNGQNKVVFRDAATGEVVTQGDSQPPAPRQDSPLADDRFLANQAQRFEQRFVSPMVKKQIDSYHQFQSHFGEAQRGNPAAYKATVSAFITNAEPGNQLRLGMLQYLQEVDPSVKGRTDIALQRLRDGTWPDSVLAGMQRVVEDNFQQVRRRYSREQADFLRRLPGAAIYVTPPDVLFGMDEAPAGDDAFGDLPGGH